LLLLLETLLLPRTALAAGLQSMTLRSGEKKTATFALDDPKAGVLLWVRGRIVLPEGEQEGAYALELTLNGTRLTPKNVEVLNKQAVYDRPGAIGDDPKRAGRKIVSPPESVDVFNAEAGGWYLKADADQFPFNAPGRPGDPYTSMGGSLPTDVPEPNLSVHTLQNLQAMVSHYYEYLFALPDGLAAKQNTLTAMVSLPKRLTNMVVEVSFGPIRPTSGVVTYHRPSVTEFTLVQQAPSLSDVVNEANGLRMSACAGEFEPTSVTLFALEAMENVAISVEPLTPDMGNGEPIPSSAAQCYYLAQRPAHQQSSARLPFTREAGPDGVAPDVLIRMAEKPVGIGHPVRIPFNYREERNNKERTAAAIARSSELEKTPGIPVNKGTSQRFLIDLKVPDGQAPGTYRGAVVLKAGDKMLRRIPLILTVQPFQLLPPRQKYWMWRQTWTPITEPSSEEAIKMIAATGVHGICRLAGIGLGMTVDKATGEIMLDDTQLRAGKNILQNAGLSLNYAQDLVSGPFYLICERKYGIRPGSGLWFGYRFMPELADTPLDARRYKPHPRGPSDEQLTRLREKLPQIKKDVIALLKRMRAKYDEVGLDPWHFAYDEPDGTHWCHPWVKFSNEVAHAAGFKTWSSHNDPLGWPSGIDMSVAAWPAMLPYVPNRIHTKPFQGKMGYRGVPLMGQFKGRLDEIAVYHRPLTDEEILQQHLKPAKGERLAYYPLDAGQGTRVTNGDGDTTFDLTLSGGKYARWVEGVKGKALQFEYPNQGEGNTDGKIGRPVPTSVSLAPSRDVLEERARIPGDGWAISFWYSGRGVLFGMPGNTLRLAAGGKADLRTSIPGEPTPSRVIIPDERGLPADGKFWNHVTISVDEKQGVIKYYLHNEAQRDWYRKNVKWNYSQYRGFNPMLCRVQAGNTAWHMRDLEHMTIFVFDLNYGIANLAWPEGGERFFNRPNTRWYPELGLLALREGIDDARYANTLYEQLKIRDGEQAAWNAVAQLFPGREVYWQKIYYQPAMEGLSYDDVRQRLVHEILREANAK